MRLSSWSIPSLVLLGGVSVSAKAILSPRLIRRNNDFDDFIERTAFKTEDGIEARSPQATTSAAPSTSSSSGTLDVGTPATDTNSTIMAACAGAMSGMTSVVNAAGFAGCYNILNWNSTTSQFMADLRIYSTQPPTGNFANVSQNMILVVLNYPQDTTFKSLTKRSTVSLEQRQSQNGMTMVQQYSLQGGFNAPLDLNKLNDTLLASMMVPQIVLQSTMAGSTFTSTMAASDTAYFATGQFTNLTSSAAIVANPSTAIAAIAASHKFVLPGTTFGIFPIGLIVTSVWTILFVIAYGAGTIARFRYRDMYRKRLSALSGTRAGPPGIGKL